MILERDTLLRAALCDELTGLGNRHRLSLERELLSVDGRISWWVAIDLDGFKRAQDAPGRGHAWGDALLVAFSSWLRETTRSRDAVLFRPGGDEFLVRVPSRKAAQAVVGRVRSWARDGVSASAEFGPSAEEADRILCEAKRARKTRR